MQLEELILGLLNVHFKNVQLYSKSVCCDALAYTANYEDPFLIEFVANQPDEDKCKFKYQQINSEISSGSIANAPIVLFSNINNILHFGILAYMDNSRYVRNSNINWHKLTDKNVKLLNVFLHIKRGTTSSLPMDFVRVKKTITLNSEQVPEAEIIYFRKFSSEYKMMQQYNTYEDRFNRLLYGIPQNEYPEDDLDKEILKEIRKTYPHATIKSSLLLFDIELMDLLIEKEKLCKKIPLRFHTLSNSNLYETQLECYYYPNRFRQIIVPNISINLSCTEDYLQRIVGTYEPFSMFTI